MWRVYIGQYLDIPKWQSELAKTWKPYMKETSISSQDATCYESYIAYPTHVKLIWKGCNEVYVLIQELSKQAGLRKSRNNYDKWKAQLLSYQKGRNKPRRKEKKLRKALLKYLRRLLDLLSSLRSKHPCRLSNRKQKRIATIQAMYDQQHAFAYARWSGSKSALSVLINLSCVPL